MTKRYKIHVDFKTKTGLRGGDDPITLQDMAKKLEDRVDGYIDDFIKLNTFNRRTLEE